MNFSNDGEIMKNVRICGSITLFSVSHNHKNGDLSSLLAVLFRSFIFLWQLTRAETYTHLPLSLKSAPWVFICILHAEIGLLLRSKLYVIG